MVLQESVGMRLIALNLIWFGRKCSVQRAYVSLMALGSGLKALGWEIYLGDITLPETNMETQKGPYKDYSPSETGLYGSPC